jgi:hypothetical protein
MEDTIVIDCVSSFIKALAEKLKILNLEDMNGRYIFRGQANCDWNIISGAGRRLLNEKKYFQNEFINYHANLLRNARQYGYGEIKSGSTLTDMELLAEIQHNGGATCLVDFTTNCLIALWMACQSTNKGVESKKDGRVIFLDLTNDINNNNIEYFSQNELPDIKKDDDIITVLKTFNYDRAENRTKFDPCFWFWNPSKINNRIIKQDSVFLFSLAAFPSVNGKKDEVGEKRIIFETLKIPYESKKNILKELDCFFSIRAETIYYDINGFSKANNYSEPISNHTLQENDCFSNYQFYKKNNQKKQSMSYLTDCISCIESKKSYCLKNKLIRKCENDKAELYLNLGKLEVNNNIKLAYYKLALKNYLDKNYQNNYTLKKIFELYKLMIDIYWKENDFAEIENNEVRYYDYYKQYIKIIEDSCKDDPNKDYYKLYGSESLLELIEFYIIRKNFTKYKEYLKEFESIRLINNSKFRKSFGYNLYILYKNIGRIIFYKNKIVHSDKIKTDTISYYYWEFDTITDFINRTKIDNTNKDEYDIRISDKSTELLTLIEKISIVQNELVNNILSSQFAFTK